MIFKLTILFRCFFSPTSAGILWLRDVPSNKLPPRTQLPNEIIKNILIIFNIEGDYSPTDTPNNLFNEFKEIEALEEESSATPTSDEKFQKLVFTFP